MTVYELMQELVQYSADAEVVIDFTTNATDVDIEEDKAEGDTITVDGEEKTGTDIGLNTYAYERYQKVHIEVEED